MSGFVFVHVPGCVCLCMFSTCVCVFSMCVFNLDVFSVCLVCVLCVFCLCLCVWLCVSVCVKYSATRDVTVVVSNSNFFGFANPTMNRCSVESCLPSRMFVNQIYRLQSNTAVTRAAGEKRQVHRFPRVFLQR